VLEQVLGGPGARPIGRYTRLLHAPHVAAGAARWCVSARQMMAWQRKTSVDDVHP
jgi:hypothetical protein